MTIKEYLLRLQTQEFRCGICGNVLPLSDQALDHDHATGIVRAILHNRCNLLLGVAHEQPETLVNAAIYLERHKSLVNI